MRGAFADALHVVFVAALVIVLVGMLTIALMPGGKPTAIRDAARAASSPRRCSPTARPSSCHRRPWRPTPEGVSPPG